MQQPTSKPGLSLRGHLYILLAVLIVTTLISFSAVFVFFSGKGAQNLGWQLQEQTMQQTQRQLRNYLQSATRINQFNQNLLETGLIAADDYRAWALQFARQVRLFEHISYITKAAPDGSWFGLQSTDELRFQRLSSTGNYYDTPFSMNEPLGNEHLQGVENLALQRDWFKKSIDAHRPVWTDVYRWAMEDRLSMSLGQPVWQQDGQLRALFAVDLSVTAISNFLRSFRLTGSGALMVLDQQQRLVASSAFQSPYKKTASGKQRLQASEYGNAMLAAVGRFLTQQTAELRLGQHYEVAWQNDVLQVLVEPFRSATGLEWLLVYTVPREDLLAGVNEGRNWALLVGLLMTLLASLLAGLMARRWTDPISRLATKVGAVRWLNLHQDFTESGSQVREVQQLGTALQHMQAGLQSFARYVPRDLVRQILSQGEVAQLGGERRLVSVLFADIQGYSALAEQLDPEQTIQILNQYFQAMQEVVVMYGGTILEHLGDSVLAVFGAPNILQNHATNSVRCAIDMCDALEALNQRWEEDGIATLWESGRLRMRIGVHRGTVVAGNIGGTEYMKYGLIGDAVNVASRLESLNKEYNSQLIISRQVYEHLDQDVAEQFTLCGMVSLKGRTQQQVIYTLNTCQGKRSSD